MRSKPTCLRCQRRRGFILFDIIFGICRAIERFGPLALLVALTCGVASASTVEAGYMKLAPIPVQEMDMAAPLRVFPTPRRVLAMLRFGAPIYGLDVREVMWVHPGPTAGQYKTGVAEYRYRYHGCQGSAQVHLIGGADIEGGWRPRDIAEMQHVGEQCGK
jgi:hypothetical protein